MEEIRCEKKQTINKNNKQKKTMKYKEIWTQN